MTITWEDPSDGGNRHSQLSLPSEVLHDALIHVDFMAQSMNYLQCTIRLLILGSFYSELIGVMAQRAYLC